MSSAFFCSPKVTSKPVMTKDEFGKQVWDKSTNFYLKALDDYFRLFKTEQKFQKETFSDENGNKGWKYIIETDNAQTSETYFIVMDQSICFWLHNKDVLKMDLWIDDETYHFTTHLGKRHQFEGFAAAIVWLYRKVFDIAID